MADRSDEEQARVFVGMLTREIDSVSAAIESAETRARFYRVRQDSSGYQRQQEFVTEFRATLYDLHRQVRALEARFPGSSVQIDAV